MSNQQHAAKHATTTKAHTESEEKAKEREEAEKKEAEAKEKEAAAAKEEQKDQPPASPVATADPTVKDQVPTKAPGAPADEEQRLQMAKENKGDTVAGTDVQAAAALATGAPITHDEAAERAVEAQKTSEDAPNTAEAVEKVKQEK